MPSGAFPTFRDPLISLFQSAVAEIGAKIDDAARARARKCCATLVSRALKDIAAVIAEREYAALSSAPPAVLGEHARDLAGQELLVSARSWRSAI